MALFKIPSRSDKLADKLVVKKTVVKKVVSRNNTLLDRINLINERVDRVLGAYKDNYMIIDKVSVLKEFIDTASKNGVIAIDTETTGLDPLLDKIVGLCLYTPFAKAAYVPINHISYVTNARLSNQLTEKEVGDCVKSLRDSDTQIIMFNANFDLRVIKNQLGVDLDCYWDGYLAARLLNENEESNGLKALHQKYVLNDAEDEFSFDELFKGISADKIPINTFYLYAAHDPVVTYELYEFQKKYLDINSTRKDMRDIAWVFHNVEMPCVKVVSSMEDNGVLFDKQYAHELSVKYNALLEERLQTFYSEIDKYSNEIQTFVRTSKNGDKLDDPINIGSSTQIAILLYDILKIEPPDPKQPRGTGVHILEKIDNPICKAILDYREVQKLLSTYIDKLPNVVNPNDGRIHCRFNQYGADTGRMSSSDPNLQNIPSHNKDIRKMFVASDGYVLLSSDYSQQEPKCLAALCKLQGDSQMYDTFMAGKDLYSEIASKAFNVPYEMCREFNADGTVNKEGKARRTQAKSILLGRLNKMPLMLAIA